MNKLRELINRYRDWRNSRKVRRTKRAVAATADTVAAGAGGVMRLGLKIAATADRKSVV